MPQCFPPVCQTSECELQGLPVKYPHEPSHRADESRPAQASPGHCFRPIKIVNDAWQNLAQDLLRGTTPANLLRSKILAFRRLDKIDVVQPDSLFFGKADRSSCRRADRVVCNRLWRASHFAYHVRLLRANSTSPSRQPPWTGERFHRHTVRQIFRGQKLSDPRSQIFFG